MSNYTGLIIISHQTFEQISREEIIESLPEDLRGLDHQIIEVKPIMRKLGDEEGIDWKSAARKQDAIWKADVRPVLESKPGHRMVYFGLAHIPLAIHLGYLIGSAKDCEIFQKNHQTNKWIYKMGNSELPQFNTSGAPNEKVIAHGEVSLRFSTNYEIKEEDIELFPDMPAAHIYKRPVKADLDSFTSHEGSQFAGIEFRNIMDVIKDFLPNVSKVHLFFAGPVGVALMMGKQVSPTIHFDKQVQIYNYQGGKYIPCFILQSLERETLAFEDDELEKISGLRKDLQECLERQIKPFLKSVTPSEEAWYEVISEDLKETVLGESSWRNFPNLSQTNLSGDSIDLEDFESSDFYKDRKWVISDYFLGAVYRRFGDDKDGILRAFRMFLFHEALHFAFQRLTENTAAGIGRFPKVLERADYEADVWAMFQEFAFSHHYNLLDSKNPQEFFADLHFKAANTMWAFDVAESDPDEMQVRRIVRYLSLYFNLARIQDPKVSTISDIANCLGNAPVIDLKGLTLKTDSEGRVIALLDHFEPSKLAIGVYHHNKVYTLGTIEPSFVIGELVKALRERDSGAVANFAKKIWDRVKQ